MRRSHPINRFVRLLFTNSPSRMFCDADCRPRLHLSKNLAKQVEIHRLFRTVPSSSGMFVLTTFCALLLFANCQALWKVCYKDKNYCGNRSLVSVNRVSSAVVFSLPLRSKLPF
ncbi:unnamed protein product [Soboliphyme baturini]|uniref:Secreted protein n=1 Tax=Soboliphyme baturini TaxID=241478 RepID=A0A183IKI2_9BILA|nr:unnamed protein product [Soboliphyme baturini]